MAVASPLALSSSLHHRLPISNPTSKRNNRRVFGFRRPSKLHLSLPNSSSPITTRRYRALMTETNITDHGADILRLCATGNLKEAIRLMCESKGLCLDAQAYCSILQLCAELGSLEDGRIVHSIISSSGVYIDSNLGTKLVFMYVECGRLSEGRKLFDEIAHNERPFLWNLLMDEYAKAGNYNEVFFLFKQMRDAGLMPDSSTFSYILECLGRVGGGKAKEVHGLVVKLGFAGCNAVGNPLIALYCKCREIDHALNLFDEMPEKDVISWNTIIRGLASNGLPGNSIELFSNMLSSGLLVDVATIVGVLSACARTGCLRVGRTVHGYSIKAGFIEDVVLQNSLIDMYSKCWNLDGAVQVFEKMNRRSEVSWSSLISAYTRAGHFEEAIASFRRMEFAGTKPDLFIIVGVLHACACNGSLEEGKYIHAYMMENEMGKDLVSANALMDMYAKCGNMLEARKVFDGMERKDIISWNTMIGGYSKNNLPNEAFNLFYQMQSFLKPNSVTMACILPAVASLAALERGKEIHAQVLRSTHLLDGYVMNALVDMYAKCGALLLAQMLFDRISKKDRITWTVMIAGYGMHGHGKSAFALFKKMRRKGMEPDEVSFTAILYACTHSGLVDEGWRIFDMMRNECRIEPNLEHYACMVDLLTRAGHLNKAFKFIKSMPQQADSTIWGLLLSGCRMHRDVKLAEIVAEQIFALEPENTGYYISLANTYAEAEKWELVNQMMKKIDRCRPQKNLGCSWIEIRNKVHIFVTGEKSHPQLNKIKLFLKDVASHMKAEGPVSHSRYALLNEDDAKREEALCGHSEKLAIAFGVLNSSKEKPIRVAKNGRVCGGCHEVAKYISKVSKREIILRDSNRFHHFEEGRCSCRGIW